MGLLVCMTIMIIQFIDHKKVSPYWSVHSDHLLPLANDAFSLPTAIMDLSPSLKVTYNCNQGSRYDPLLLLSHSTLPDAPKLPTFIWTGINVDQLWLREC